MYPPTVLDRVDPQSDMVVNECFGSTGPINRGKDLEPAVGIANTTEHDGMRGVGAGTWAFSALLVLVTFALDPSLAIFLGGIAVVFHLVRTLLALRPTARPGFRAGVGRLVVYCAVFASSSGIYAVNAGMVQDSAQAIIAALHGHRAANGRYPDRLSELVPVELAEVPSAAPLLVVDRWFRYRRSGQGFELSYVSGFLVDRVYDAQTESWSVRD